MIRISARIGIIAIAVVGADVEAGRLHLEGIDSEGQEKKEGDPHEEDESRVLRSKGNYYEIMSSSFLDAEWEIRWRMGKIRWNISVGQRKCVGSSTIRIRPGRSVESSRIPLLVAYNGPYNSTQRTSPVVVYSIFHLDLLDFRRWRGLFIHTARSNTSGGINEVPLNLGTE